MMITKGLRFYVTSEESKRGCHEYTKFVVRGPENNTYKLKLPTNSDTIVKYRE